MKENGSAAYTVETPNGDFKTYNSDGSSSYTTRGLNGDLKTYGSDGSSSRTVETLNGDLKTYNSDGSTSYTTKTLNGDYKTYNSDGSTSYTQVRGKGRAKTYSLGGTYAASAKYEEGDGGVQEGQGAAIFGVCLLGLCCVLAFTSVGRSQYIVLGMIIVLCISLRILRKVINPSVLGVWAQLCGAELYFKLVSNIWNNLRGSEGIVFGLIGGIFLMPLVLSYLFKAVLGLDRGIEPSFFYYLMGFNKWIYGDQGENAFIFKYAIYLIYGIWFIYGIGAIIKYAKRKELFVRKSSGKDNDR